MAIRIDGTNTTANPGITGADADTGLQFGTNELKLVTGGTEAVKIDSNQKLTASQGILFGTDTAAANTLDDYEEGTWTPTYIGATTAGSYTFTSDTWYTKVGNKVTAYAKLQNITDVSLGSGTLNIGGLPYANGSSNALGSVLLNNFNVDDSTVNLTAFISDGDSVVKFFETRDNAGTSGVSVTDRTLDSSDMYLQITYKVD
jgi:hypothetical protein